MQIPKEEINKRIKHVVSLSKQIPWYAKKYEELGIDPDTIKTPQDLLKAYEKGLYTTPQDLPELVYYKHPNAKGPFYTSGTTGKPKEIWLNPDDHKWLTPQWGEAFNTILRRQDKILVCLPRPPAISAYMVCTALSTYGYDFLHYPSQEIGENILKFVEEYKKFSPNTLISLSTFAYRLPLLLQPFNVEPELDYILIGGEPTTVERRKRIGDDLHGLVYDLYPSSECGLMAVEFKPFSDEHHSLFWYTLPFLVKDNASVEAGEIGNVIFTNLSPFSEKPYMILLNYRIGDWAKCIEVDEKSGIVTVISEIRREAAYLAGAKLNPQEIEAIIESLGELKGFLTGEYCIITYNDAERKAVAEVRLESRKPLSEEQKVQISQEVQKRIYEANIPVHHLVEIIKDAKLTINVTEPGELYKGYEQYVKPGKPKRLITLG